MATAKNSKNVNKLALSDNISPKNVIDEKKFSVSNDVVGLLQYNTDIRNNALIKNAGKYPLYEGILSPAIGEVSTITTRYVDYITKNGLLDYTHNRGSKNSKNEYGDYINDMYFRCGNKEVYKSETLYQPWSANWCDYTQYIDEVLGEDCISFHINLINGLLANEFTESQLRLNEVAVVRDFQVNAAMAGAVTTNVNNFSGMDTKMGLISNQMYSHSLYHGSAFNSTRMGNVLHIGDYNIPKSYITPSLYNQYGNNSSTIFRLAEILRLNDGEQFVREDLGKDIRFNDVNNNYAINFIPIQYTEAEKYLSERGFTNRTYSLEKGNHYVNGEMDNVSGRYVDDSNLFGYNGYKKSSDKLYATPVYGMYSEGDIAGGDKGVSSLAIDTPTDGLYEGIYDTIDDSLINKTNKLFNEHKISTMIGRFHTTLNDGNDITDEIEMIDSAKSKGYGNSHGRNLLKLDARTKTSENNTNGYDNPYCRTWTFHHQYNQLKKMIRPFIDNKGEAYTLTEIQKMNMKNRSYVVDINNTENTILDGATKLGDKTVLQDNGFVRITPQFDEKDKSIKDCMFSIENLAWKDFTKKSGGGINKRVISEEQTGPNGGRIMWFPPYDLDFQESVNVDWNSNSFIGRGENVYTYKNTTRTGTLSFSLLIDHPSIINKYVKDCGEGMGEEKDPHADLLRFFAGCEFLKGEIKVDEDEKGDRPPETQEPPEETINIRVYFPNNFSGIYGTDSQIYQGYDKFTTEDNEPLTYDVSDSDNADYWWRYLLVGNTTTIPADETLFVGYEMRSSGTTTLTENTGYNVIKEGKELHVCKNQIGKDSKLGEEVINCEKDDKIKNVYHYYVDEDMHNNPGSDNSFKDMKTNGLNSVISNEERGENEFSFAELMYALLTYNNTIFKDKEYTEKYKNYLKDKIKISIENANKIKDIFENNTVKYTNITVQGGASKNGHEGKNKVLSERRGWVIKDLLKRSILNGNTDENLLKNRQGTIAGEKNASVSSEDNKKARSSLLTITFTRSESENVSDGTTNEQKEKLEGFITYDEFKQVLIESSDVIKILSETKGVNLDKIIEETKIWENDTYPKEGWVSETKVYTGDTGINTVLTKFFDNNTTIDDYIKLAYSISVEPVFNEFMSKVNTNIGGSNSINDDEPKVKKAKEKCDKLQEEINSLEEENRGYEAEIKTIKEKQKNLLENLPEDSNTEDDENISIKEDSKIMREVNNLEQDINKLNKKISNNIEKINEKKDEYTEKYNEYFKALRENANTDIDDALKQINENRDLCLKYRNLFQNELIGNIYSQKCDEDVTVESVKIGKVSLKGRTLVEIEGAYNSLTSEYSELINNNDAKKKEIKKITKEIKKVAKVYDNLLTKIHKEEDIVETGDTFYLKNDEVCHDTKLNQFFTPEFASSVNPNKIKEFYEKDEKDSKYAIALNFGNDSINIETLDKRIDEYNKEIDKIKDEEKELNKRNAIDSGVTLSYMYIYGETIDNNKGSDDSDKFTASGYSIKRLNFKDDGTKEEGNTSINDLSYKKLLKEYLFIDYVTDNYHSEFGDDLYLFFEVIPRESDEEKSGMEDIKNVLYAIFKVDIGCCGENCSGCTKDDIERNEKLKEGIKDTFDDYVNAENGVKAKIQAKREEEMENQPSQNITENNESPEEKLERERQAELDSIMKWAMLDVSQFNNRYETEAEYFSKLKMSDPFTYKNLVDKFKYFNPAFHAITPEGFNARLTFLQQCTRQGATSEMTGIGNGGITSNNLAFGRMPVCVLRIGDFIHTRIIIQSISINYGANGAMQWDLNPEGAGVQPMYAKVSMNIVLIGGQSLETPISRLQNALSFNYYANAESYDNRADSAIYENGEVKYKYVFDPMNQEEVKWGEQEEKAKTPAENVTNIETTNGNEDKVVKENQSQEELDKASGVDVVDNGYKKGKINRPKPGVDKASWELYGYLTNVLPSELGLKIINQQENIIVEYVINPSTEIIEIKTVDLSKYKIELSKSNGGVLDSLIEKYKNDIITTINTGKTQDFENTYLIKGLISTVTK